MMAFDGTYGIVFMPDFDSIDESFDFRNELVPKLSHPDHHACFSRCSCVEKLLANRISIGMENKEIASDDAKETKSIMDDYCMPIRGFEMTCDIISGLVPRLGTKNTNHDPTTLKKTLVAKNGGSCEKFSTQFSLLERRLWTSQVSVSIP